MPRTISSPRRSRRCSFMPWVTHRRRVNHQNTISVFTSPQIFLTLPGHISCSSMATKILKALRYGQRLQGNPTVHVVSSHGPGKYLKCIPIHTRDPRLEIDQKFLVKVRFLVKIRWLACRRAPCALHSKCPRGAAGGGQAGRKDPLAPPA